MNALTSSVETILAQAVEIAAPAERQAFVERACGGDRTLQGRVEQLIANHFQAGSFLERPAVAIDPQGTAGWEAARSADAVGTVIGPYKLLEQIGEGGMGLVFVAEQHEPIRRRVALKVIKPGMDSRQVIARFEAERQALALMDHPHIAKVHDGGATPQGRPYFVMELVKGIPITDYCDQHRLSTRQRLQLFLDVCHAVQHAHQKGIIHRDLKPSNVLVEVHDVHPVVKVIDFGIAKAMGQQLTDKTVYTGIAQMIGTPSYMSPEQAGLSSLDVDTRSDLYSLGVMLYELLTGTTPFDSEALKRGGYDEMRRIIREDEPPRPSTRLSTIEQAALSTIAERRGMEPRRLSQQLRGELDWIVMKALEKDRNRRYESAGAFAADVQRYLTDEPVHACPPSKLYRLRKFSRKHKAALGVAACVLGVLVLAGVALWWEQEQWAAAAVSIETALERANMLRQEERWQEALAVLAVAQGQSEGLGLGTLRQRVQQLRRDVDMLMRLEEARLQTSIPEEKHWGYAGADRLYAQAFQRYGIDMTILDPEEAARRVQASAIGDRLTEALDDWAFCREENSDRKGSKALRTAARLADDDPWRQRLREAVENADRAGLEALAEREDTLSKSPASLVSLGRALSNLGNEALAERLLWKAQAVHPADFWLNFDLAYTLATKKSPELGQATRFLQAALALRPGSVPVLGNLGNALRCQGKWPEAEAAYRKAITLKPEDAILHTGLGLVLRDEGKWPEAEAAHRKAISLKPDLAEAHNNLSVVLVDKGQLNEAIAEACEAIRLQKKYPSAHNSLGNALSDKGRVDEAIAEYREAIRIEKDYAEAHYNLGIVLNNKGQLDEAIAEYREAIGFKHDYVEAHYNLGLVLHNKGQMDEAIAEYREAIRIKKDFAKAAMAHNNLGNTLAIKGRLDEAIDEFRESIRIKKDNAEAHYNLGLALSTKGRLDEAIIEYREAIRIKHDFAMAAMAHYNLGNALNRKGRRDEAIAEYREAIRIKKDYREAHTNLGNALASKGRLEEAIAEYHEALKKNFPEAYQAHNSLAWLLATCPDQRLRDTSQAVTHAKKAVELAPGHAGLWNTLGVAHYRNGDWKAAIAVLNKSVQLHKGGDSSDYFFLAMAHWQLNEKDKARAWYDRAVAWMDKHNPQDPELKRFRSEATALLGLAKTAEVPNKNK